MTSPYILIDQLTTYATDIVRSHSARMLDATTLVTAYPDEFEPGSILDEFKFTLVIYNEFIKKLRAVVCVPFEITGHVRMWDLFRDVANFKYVVEQCHNSVSRLRDADMSLSSIEVFLQGKLQNVVNKHENLPDNQRTSACLSNYGKRYVLDPSKLKNHAIDSKFMTMQLDNVEVAISKPFANQYIIANAIYTASIQQYDQYALIIVRNDNKAIISTFFDCYDLEEPISILA